MGTNHGDVDHRPGSGGLFHRVLNTDVETYHSLLYRTGIAPLSQADCGKGQSDSWLLQAANRSLIELTAIGRPCGSLRLFNSPDHTPSFMIGRFLSAHGA